MSGYENLEHIRENVLLLVDQRDDKQLGQLFIETHFADIADILNELEYTQANYLFRLLEKEKAADVLTELEEETRNYILEHSSSTEIATRLEDMDTDDAADMLAEVSDERRETIFAAINNDTYVGDIKELMTYAENSAGGLMAKELVSVQENWTVSGCLAKIRTQAQNVTRVHSVYVVDQYNSLIGRLSLKDLLIARDQATISQIYIPKVTKVHVHTSAEEVARIMQKYDLEALPVIDDDEKLLGRITIDDILDFVKEEADKDYQMAAGISQDVEANDGILELTKARLPWLILGMLGGLASVFIMQSYEPALQAFPKLFFFTPLIAAMAGNVGVQSSAIIVQGLANDTVKGSMLKRLLKELALSGITATVLGALIIVFTQFIGMSLLFGYTIALALLGVIIVAAIIGTFIPIILSKRGVDPAIATGPFITTSNDIFGIYLFFQIARYMLNF